MPISRNGYPVMFDVSSYAKRISSAEGYSDFIAVGMSIAYDDLFSHPNFNVVYGYWVRAKESAQIL
jgi:hypothetical protein